MNRRRRRIYLQYRIPDVSTRCKISSLKIEDWHSMYNRLNVVGFDVNLKSQKYHYEWPEML